MDRRRVARWCVVVICALAALPATAAAQGPPADNEFEVTTLAKGADKTGEPIAMAVLPDRRVLHTSRDGRVWLTTPNATTSLAGTIPVYSHDEDGLQGIAIDADFATNRWVYVYYAPPLTTPAGDAPNDGVSLRRLQGPQPARRGSSSPRPGRSTSRPSSGSSRCPPTAASAATPAARSTSTPRATCTSRPATTRTRSLQDGYTPIDERATRNPSYDAQRSSANTNDLRGKLLRIKVAADGTYTVPDGNLFAAGDRDKTRPEIYAMGFRNPFRFAVDRRPAGSTSATTARTPAAPIPNRGPGGQVEFNLIKSAGQLWLAVLPRPQRRLQRLRLRHRRLGREVRLRGARRTPRRATPAWSTCRRRGRRGSPTTPATCRSSAAAASRRWAARPTTSTRPTRRRRSSPRTSTARASPTSSAAAGSAR